MTVLITGAMGFSGKALYKALKEFGKDNIFTSDIQSTSLENYTACDLSNIASVQKLIDEIMPDAIFNLVGTFSNDYNKDYSSNVLVTKNILDSVNRLNKPCRVFLVGSAAEYGAALCGSPVDEESLLKPTSIYGLTKVLQTHIMKYYINNYDMDIVMARPFNIYGKNISEKLFVGRVYQQIKMLKDNKTKKIVVGNLESERDYISLDETINHYVKIMEHGKKGEIYNVGNGIPMKTDDMLRKILKEESIDYNCVESKVIDNVHKYDVKQIYADITKLKGLN